MKTTNCFDYNECLSYIEKIKDFEMIFESPPVFDTATNRYEAYQESKSIKHILQTFLISCQSKCSEVNEYYFLKWLENERLSRKGEQRRAISKINIDIENATGKEKAHLIKNKENGLNFFEHYRELIKIISGSSIKYFAFQKTKMQNRSNFKIKHHCKALIEQYDKDKEVFPVKGVKGE